MGQVRERVTNEAMAHELRRVQLAVRTLRLLPSARVREKMTSWPEIVRDFSDIWHATLNHEAPPPRVLPTARQISEMDEVLHALASLARVDPDMPRYLWAKACGFSLRRIAARTQPRVSYETIRTAIHNGLYLMAARHTK